MPLFLTWKVIFSVQNQENQQIKEPSADKIIEGLNQENQQSSEPSADEIIEVLKNLEQLAAKNPALYRAITDQIKLNIWIIQTQDSSRIFWLHIKLQQKPISLIEYI